LLLSYLNLKATESKLGKKTVKGKRKEPSIIKYVTWNVMVVSHKEEGLASVINEK
jgi:hypothetical protein